MTTLTLNGSETLVVQESTADRFQVEATYQPRGSRPPKHVHPHHDESFTVLAGTLRVGFVDHEQDVTAGDSFDVPRGTVHHMWNPGDAPATVCWLSTPAARVEPFFTAMDRLHRDGRAGLVGLAGVLNEYRDVMRPASPLTRAVVRVLGPLSRPVGR
ncbi:cupin domain-containing protein [Cellulosimicrobium arenosum]|uniref:Cupin domain-containing protein n=1 Tax=Cellulosimicrobium arenosum TaxID=2708133 RepID=A0A927J1P1_9MICO|nr:cupin domain-containing protein [Cellulosimicrobium arenosum]MBD8080294.1 cupin domain-containing protein [Cellulosimicrobium arenosum]